MADDLDLQVSVMVGDRLAVKKYISAKGDLEVKDDDGATALMHAAFWSHVEIAQDLISAGANMYAQRSDGYTALHVATKNNQARMTEVLVGAMNHLDMAEEFGDTALHCAYRSKASECIEILLAGGADSEALNHMGKTPRECEGTGVDRPPDEYDFDDDNGDGVPRGSAAASEAPSIGDQSTVVGDPAEQSRDSRLSSGKSPNRPNDTRSAAASSSPRTNRNRYGAHTGDEPVEEDMGSASTRAQFRVAYPPAIRGGGKWHSLTAYLFEPSAYSAVRDAHRARINGEQHHPFAASDNSNTVEDCDKTIPSYTEIVVRPRFPRTCCVSPVNATVVWMKDAHAVPFEVRPPASTTSGTISGWVDFYVGVVLIAQASVEMAVVKPNGNSDARDKPDVLGPVGKVFDTTYVCYAEADKTLLMPSLDRVNRLGISTIVWRPTDWCEKETKRLIRESFVFQICWSISAKGSDRVRNEIKFASSLAKSGSVALRAIYWNPSMEATPIQTAHGLIIPVQLHNSFLLEEACAFILDRATDTSSSSPGTARGGQSDQSTRVEADGDHHDVAAVVPDAEKLHTTAVRHTRGHISILRGMVSDASVVDCPRLVWIYPDDNSKPLSVDITTNEWLKKPIRMIFLCPISMKPGRCGEDGRGYKMTLPLGWTTKIGMALRIGVVVVAAASDAGEVADLPLPPVSAISSWGGQNGGEMSLTQKQRDLVNAAFDGLSDVLPGELNDIIDSTFVDAETEETSAALASAQLRDQVKLSYMNLRSWLQKYDKGLKNIGLVKVTHDGLGDTPPVTEWVHPSVAELFRRQGPLTFGTGALAAADADAAREAVARHKDSKQMQRSSGGGGGSGRGESTCRGQGVEVLSTIRLLEKQVLAMVEAGKGGSRGA